MTSVEEGITIHILKQHAAPQPPASRPRTRTPHGTVQVPQPRGRPFRRRAPRDAPDDKDGHSRHRARLRPPAGKVGRGGRAPQKRP